MQRVLALLIFVNFSIINYAQIIADHTVVDKFDDIPQAYIDEVRKMWVVIAGESHSRAYRDGLLLLEEAYPAYSVNVTEEGTPEAYSTSNLRASGATWGDHDNSSGWIYWYGEEDWFTNATAISRTKAGITYCNTHNLTISALGLGWCADLTEGAGTDDPDPEYGCHWFGNSLDGPQGDHPTGINATDYSITGNTVCMDTYLSVTQEYIDYCTTNGYPTNVFFTTGPVDADNSWYGEKAYQGNIKHEYIRNYVKTNKLILFDYADILCYDNNGTPATDTWSGHTFPVITITNVSPVQTGHISNAGAVRLAKAMWWMLARMSGWDGGNTAIPVTGIEVTGAGGTIAISADNGTLQLSEAITPSNATNQTVAWSIINGTGEATISTTGLVTAVVNGTVTAKATANDGSGVYGQLVITISNQVIPVRGISVTGVGGATTITTGNGTLQLNAAIEPANAANQSVIWSIINGTGDASISSAGLVTAISNGTVTAKATASDGSGVFGTLIITLSNQIVPVTGISVTGAGGASLITTIGGTLQLSAAITPSNATNQTVTWSVLNETGEASISSAGLITAITQGEVTAIASATDRSGVSGTLDITIEYIEPFVIVVAGNEMRIHLDEIYVSSRLNLYNLQGHLIDSKLVDSSSCTFNISSVPPGIYIVALSKSAISVIRKVIIPD